jgi:hypothetical protein
MVIIFSKNYVTESGEALFKTHDERYKKKEEEGNLFYGLQTFNLQPSTFNT